MKVKVTQSCLTLCDPIDYTVHGILQARKLEWVAFPFSRVSSQPRDCGQILYQLSHKGSPRILEWVTYPFSRGSSWSRNRTRVSCIAGRFFTSWAMREAQNLAWGVSIHLSAKPKLLPHSPHTLLPLFPGRGRMWGLNALPTPHPHPLRGSRKGCVFSGTALRMTHGRQPSPLRKH